MAGFLEKIFGTVNNIEEKELEEAYSRAILNSARIPGTQIALLYLGELLFGHSVHISEGQSKKENLEE